MKIKLLLCLSFCLLLCSFSGIHAQKVYIPDINFQNKLISLGFGSCIVGDSIDSTCSQVANAIALDLSNSSITNLQGIQAFDSLKSLNVNNNFWLSIPALPPLLDSLLAEYCGISALPALPDSMTYLDLKNNSLPTLPNLPQTLRYLECGNNLLGWIPVLSDSLRFLNCNSNSLTSLPSLPANLITLICSQNPITVLPALPSSLLDLSCSQCHLTSLPALPPILADLYCDANQLSSLPALPSFLTYLNCSYNLLSALPALPSSITNLYCSYNQITSLPALPSNLQWFECGQNSISVMPSIPSGVFRMECWENLLTSLPALPQGLVHLRTEYNQLTSLPALPSSLGVLGCSHNNITSLPLLPASLQELYASYNQISSVTNFPSGLGFIYLDNNQLSSIPDLPSSINTLLLNDNLQLTCLPLLKDIGTLNFNNCPLSCLPNFGNVTNSIPALSSLPLCNIFNTNGCNFYWNINGKTYNDADQNCSQSISETDLSYVHINLFKNNVLDQQVFTSNAGMYSFVGNSFDNYEVQLDTTALPFSTVCPLSNNYLDTIGATDSLFYDNDFALKCKSGFDAGVRSIYSSILRPARRSVINIRAGDVSDFYGVHCASGISGTPTVTINGNAHYFGPVAGSLTPSFTTSNIVTFTIANWGTISSNTDFTFEIETNSGTVPGSSICFNVSISSSASDNNLTNNSLSNCFTVKSSYDPNNKEVYPSGIIDTSQHDLTYTIRFQNTGTAPAEHIYILDTLDNNIDVSSFQLLATSHPAYVQVLSGGIVRFNFPNINLPDSNSNESLSHGFVQYKVRLKNNLSIGTNIKNKARIYFDSHPPVATNTTTNIVDIVNGLKPNENDFALNVWPVPFENYFMLEIDESLIGSDYSIENILGKIIASGKVSSGQMTIYSQNWPSGIYFLRVEMKSKSIERKLIRN